MLDPVTKGREPKPATDGEALADREALAEADLVAVCSRDRLRVADGEENRDRDCDRDADAVTLKPRVGDLVTDGARDRDELAAALSERLRDTDEVALGDADGGSVGQTTRIT